MKTITIKEEIRFDYDKKKKVIIVYKIEHLHKLMGAKSIASNLHIYKITKQANTWEIPVNVLEARMQVIQGRIDDNIVSMNLMRQVARQIK